LVADSGNGRVRSVTYAGELKTLVSGLEVPAAIAVDSRDRIYVADSKTGLVHRIDERGQIRIFSRGTASKPFQSPLALAVDAADNIYIADTGNNLIRRM